MDKRQLPKHWTSYSIKSLLSFVLGGDWGKDPLKFNGNEYELAICIRGSEIKNWNINKSSTAVERLIKKTSLEKRTLFPGDVVVEISGGGPEQPVGRTIYIDEESLKNEKDLPSVCTNFLRLMRFYPVLNSKFIQLYLQLFYDTGQIINYQGGSNNLRNLKFKEFETIQIPLPPRPEQDRIVTKVDILMAQVETMQKSLERIPQLLNDFRQQILSRAVTGKLTEDWRVGKNLSNIHKEFKNDNFQLDSIPQTWVHTVIENIASVKGGKRVPKGHSLTEQNTGFPYIRARDLKEGTVLVDNLLFLEPETQQIIKRYIVKENDLYITVVGAKIGDAGIVPKSMDGANLTENANKLTELEEGVVPKYLDIWLRSDICQNNIQESIKSAAQGKLALGRIKTLPVYLPSETEQIQIVKQTESLLKKADQIEEGYSVLKSKIDNLPQAVLHKAFKGELVEPLPGDGDAKELLEEIENLKIP
ncbi:restriction endonuclease subunit S [Flagellimonas marinaquae]|uniref:restriction endonuclease subunit S n=1 Tax=Flagellimonas marinaquae TaxID=254955 RepID=UPI000F8D7A66|nr:restriction endonuclease subunit S [Allomuricauda aquimarina]